MKPSDSDIVEINQLLALWGHLIDQHAGDRFGEVLAEDAHYDCSIFGFAAATGIDAVRDLFDQPGHARVHYTTNVHVQEGSGDAIVAESKGLGILVDGSLGSVTFSDVFRQSSAGWRLASRILKF